MGLSKEQIANYTLGFERAAHRADMSHKVVYIPRAVAEHFGTSSKFADEVKPDQFVKVLLAELLAPKAKPTPPTPTPKQKQPRADSGDSTSDSGGVDDKAGG